MFTCYKVPYRLISANISEYPIFAKAFAELISPILITKVPNNLLIIHHKFQLTFLSLFVNQKHVAFAFSTSKVHCFCLHFVRMFTYHTPFSAAALASLVYSLTELYKPHSTRSCLRTKFYWISS